jgi:N utilization substance protein B
VIEEFKAHRLGDDGENGTAAQADPSISPAAQGRGPAPARHRPMIDRQLAEGWRLTRIDSIVRAILRAAAFELMELEDVPPRVVISEYIEVAHAFFEGDEPRVVNGVLDSLARKL